MKRTRRVFALLVAAIFALGLVPTGAWGATTTARYPTETGTIILNNAEDGETYNAYRILTLLSFADDTEDLDPNEHENDRYSYGIKSDSPWIAFFATGGEGSAYFEYDTTHPITVVIDPNDSNKDETYYPISINKTGPFWVDSNSDNVKDSEVGDEVGRTASIASGAAVQDFAQKAISYANTHAADMTGDNKYTVQANDTNASVHSPDDGKVDITFNAVKLGYYLVDSTLGSFVALDTTNTSVTVLDKNEGPTIDKKVKLREHDTNTAADNRDSTTNTYTNESTVWTDDFTDYDIGDEVTFKTKITVKKGAKGYVLHDVMEKGLTFSGSTSVSVWATNVAEPANMGSVTADSTTFQVFTTETTGSDAVGDGCDFHVKFADSWLAGLTYNNDDEAIVEVEYKAKLNKDAVVKGDTETASGDDTTIAPIEGVPATPSTTQVPQIKRDNNTDNSNTNSTLLCYGAGSSTEWDSAKVDTFQFDLVKTKEASAGDATLFDLLADAKFELYRSDGAATPARRGGALSLVNVATSDTQAQVYAIPDSSQLSDNTVTKVTEVTTTAGQKITFRGLEEGTYFLHEKQAPAGYNALANPGDVMIVVDKSGNIKVKMPGTTEQLSPTAAPWKATLGGNATQATYDNDAASQGGVHVINQTGPELPSTGGIGTTIFYVVGGILVAGSAVLLITKRRMSTEA